MGWVKIFSFPREKKRQGQLIAAMRIACVAQTGAAYAQWYELGKDLNDEMW